MKHKCLPFLLVTILLCGCQASEDTVQVATTINVPASFVFYGEVKVKTEEEVLIDFPAQIKEIHVQEGDLVHKGDVLFTLDLNDHMYQINVQENLLETYEAQLDGLISQTNPYYAQITATKDELKTKQNYLANGTDSEIHSVQNNLIVLEEQLQLANEQLIADQALFEIDSISEQAIKQDKQACLELETKIATQKNNLNSLMTNKKLEISTLQNNIEKLQLTATNTDLELNTKIKTLQTQIKGAKLTLDYMKAKLAKPYLKETQVIATSDNLIVASIPICQGMLIDTTPIISLLHQDSLYILADLPEEDLTKVNLGDEVQISFADKSLNTSLVGKIKSISHQARVKDGDTVVEAEIEVTGDKSFLRAGLTVDLTLCE